MAISFRSETINYSSSKELMEKIRGLNATKIISIKPAFPEATDTKHWIKVYYEYRI
jgi:hypothetical protein